MEHSFVLPCDSHLSCASVSKMLALSEVQVPQEKIFGSAISTKDGQLNPSSSFFLITWFHSLMLHIDF